MLFLKILIFELLAIDTLSARTITLGKVAALNHEAFDHAVEARALVVQRFAGSAYALLAGT